MSDDLAIDVKRLAREVELDGKSVAATVRLLDDGNTMPFITRYRRDQTGGLDEQQIERIREVLAKHRALAERKQTILRSIESQHKLTDQLREQIERADSVKRLEDLYLPYRPKKESLASKARDAGLGPLADEVFSEQVTVENLQQRATEFVNVDKGVPDVAHALLGAGHLLAEQFNERADLRGKVRKLFRNSGRLLSNKVGDDEKKNNQYKDFLEYSERINRVPPHRILAINRGEKAKLLRVKIEADHSAISRLATELLVKPEHQHKDFLVGCVKDMLTRLLLPSLEREFRRELSEKAELHAVKVFAKNLRNLLLQPPLLGRRILAVDPGFKAGCKLAALSEAGEMLDHAIVHIVGSDEKKLEARTKLTELIQQHDLKVAAIGNGTGCRQTEELIADILANELKDAHVEYIVVNEAGASVYSTSEIGREELPDCDPMQRSAISIGRRLQDPLSELVKIDPASIGVGLYQHDAKAKHLRDMLDEVVQSCVSYVGVDVNTASAALLRYVSGMNQLTARRVYEHRKEHGPFKNRQQLLEVSGLGEATFVQAAGFLKIDGADDPLDGTWVHPENYVAAEKLLGKLEIDKTTLKDSAIVEQFRTQTGELDREAVATELEIGQLALEGIIQSLAKPGRDPREDLPPPLFRRDIVKFEQLETGMELAGTVLNVVDFGAFVDVGLSDSGLVHISQLSNDYIRDPHQAIAVGDRVRTWVAKIDKDRRRVALTMIEPGTEKAPEEKRERPKRGKRRGGQTEGRQTEGQGGEKSKQSDSSGSGRPARRGKPSGKPGGRKGNQRGGRRPQPTGPRSFEQRAKKTVEPITEKMAEGKEYLRSFGDLLQFQQKQSHPEKGEPKEPKEGDSSGGG